MNKFIYILIGLLAFTQPFYAATLDTDYGVLNDSSFNINLQDVYAKIRPTITYAALIQNESGFDKGDIVEVIQDVANGTHYEVSNHKFRTWVHGYNLKFLKHSNSAAPPTIYPIELEAYINSYNNPSKTPYFVWVDLARQTIYVFNGSNKHWQLCKFLICASGKLVTPTIRGTFEIQDRGIELYGPERAKYWVKFHENYLFHSLPIDTHNNLLDSRLGVPVSNGCIRMHEEDAKWFFDTIPTHTTVWIY